MSENLVKDIWDYRVAHNMSAKKFAELCNVTEQTIHNILTETQKPSTMTVLKIRKVLDQNEE